MELEMGYVIFSGIVCLVLLLALKKGRYYRRPPGPPGVPLFGNMFDLGTMPHQTLANMKSKYGPVVWLRIGSVRAMAILSAKVAGEFFKNHDASFAEHEVVDTMRAQDYHTGSMVLAPYGSYWRMIRRICSTEIFVHKRLAETAHIRRKCVDEMLVWIEKEANSGKPGGSGVHPGRFIFLSMFNLFGNLMVSRDLVDPTTEKASEFFNAMEGFMVHSGTTNLSDIFPFLRWLDIQGLRRRANRDVGIALGIVSALVKERLEEKQRHEYDHKKNDFLDVLLNFEGNGKDEPAKLTEHQINVFILEMFMGGTETTSSTLEWALSELLRNPKAMSKAKEEIYQVVGRDRRLEETDIENLPYLQAVIKETFRLHPLVPLLLPRRAIQDTKFMDYDIPKGSQVLVNVWAMGRDPEIWEEPLRFKPERFLGSNIDFKGQNYELLPFGSGRRICVGLPLGDRMLHFILGSLLHSFDWDLEPNVTPEMLDMKERMGITFRKFEPLKVIPRKAAA